MQHATSKRPRYVLIGLAIVAVVSAAAAGAVGAGLYNVAADNPHYGVTAALLEQVRERSVAVRAAKLTPPTDLFSEARITQGAGNYAAMCVGCHLAPGLQASELSRGLYPAPPDLSKEDVDAAEAFWVIKHGIKASGMPAWGRSMGDEYIWNMAAFVQRLPRMSPEDYARRVAQSGGHSHGGNETGGAGHGHGDGAPGAHAGHDAGGTAPAAAGAEAGGTTHVHADGRTHLHEAKPAASPLTPPQERTHVHADGKAHVHATQPTQPQPASANTPRDDPAGATASPEKEHADGHHH